MSTTCQKCGTTWGGLSPEHCKACHQTFTSTAAGDKHRTGKHDIRTGPDSRRCRTAEEMELKGMTRNRRGHWTTGGGAEWLERLESEPGANL
jgi:hypothetical protein